MKCTVLAKRIRRRSNIFSTTSGKKSLKVASTGKWEGAWRALFCQSSCPTQSCDGCGSVATCRRTCLGQVWQLWLRTPVQVHRQTRCSPEKQSLQAKFGLPLHLFKIGVQISVGVLAMTLQCSCNYLVLCPQKHLTLLLDWGVVPVVLLLISYSRLQIQS